MDRVARMTWSNGGLGALCLLCAVAVLGCPQGGTSGSSGPAADFSASTAGLVATFQDTSQTGSAAITAWSWDFGDGGTSTKPNPSHTYAAAGTYTVSLTVTTSAGSDTKTGTVVVTAVTTTPAGPQEGPTAAFNAAPTIGVCPFEVVFSDLSAAGSSPIVSWAWTFGDGGTSAAKNPSHTYGSAGSFTVSLTVKTAVGNDVGQGTITVKEPMIRYVKPGGTGDGSSWADASGSIQDAVDSVGTWGGGEVWVAAGTYRAGSSSDENVVVMAGKVGLYGGFAGYETERGAQVKGSVDSIIDGESVRRCVLGANGTVLDGFSLMNGNCTEGGGLLCGENMTMQVQDCTFSGNAAEYGGGLCEATGAGLTVTNCVFLANSATYGGGVWANGQCSLTVDGCQFTKNEVNSGGGIWADHECLATVKGCEFGGNEAQGGGGGFVAYGAILDMDCCRFLANRAISSSAGGLFGYFSPMSVVNCLFADNVSGDMGGGIMVASDSASNGELVNCTFSGNWADAGGAIADMSTDQTTVRNCILWGDSSGTSGTDEIFVWVSSPSVTYSCVEGGFTGTGNITDNPSFVNAGTGDYTLQGTSECIDKGASTGAPAVDLLGAARPQGSGIDMGAYEYAGK